MTLQVGLYLRVKAADFKSLLLMVGPVETKMPSEQFRLWERDLIIVGEKAQQYNFLTAIEEGK